MVVLKFGYANCKQILLREEKKIKADTSFMCISVETFSLLSFLARIYFFLNKGLLESAYSIRHCIGYILSEDYTLPEDCFLKTRILKYVLGDSLSS